MKEFAQIVNATEIVAFYCEHCGDDVEVFEDEFLEWVAVAELERKVECDRCGNTFGGVNGRATGDASDFYFNWAHTMFPGLYGGASNA